MAEQSCRGRRTAAVSAMTVDIERLNAMPFARHIGMVFQRANNGECVVTLDTQPLHGNTRGDAHGGIMPMIIDAAGATAILSTAPDAAVLTADLRVNFIAPVGSGQRITAIGRVVQGGGSTAYAAVVVTAESGATLALGQVTGVVKRKV